MAVTVSTDVLEPLLVIAERHENPQVRIAVLDTASRFPLSEEAWQRYARVLHEAIIDESPGSSLRRAALALAVRVPLLSLRRHLREMATDPHEPDRDVLLVSLEQAGDPSSILPLLVRAAAGDSETFQLLAAMPVEDVDIEPAAIPQLPDDAPSDTSLWHALVLARLGDFAALDAILEGRAPVPELFWGSPWTAYDAIAAIRPIAVAMHNHLLETLERLAESEQSRMVRLITWAATGIADAEGQPLTDTEPAGYADTSGPSQPSNEAIAVAEELPQRMFDHAVSSEELDILTALPPEQITALVEAVVAEGNRRAEALESGTPAEVLLGNEIINVVSKLPDSDNWPVVELAIGQLEAGRTALDEGQLAWVISRAQPAHVIDAVTGLLTLDRPAAEHEDLLQLLGCVADYYADRGGSPARGAGPSGGTGPIGRGMLIDDELHTAAIGPDDYELYTPSTRYSPTAAATPTDEEEYEEEASDLGATASADPLDGGIAEPEDEEIIEERRVQAQIRHNGQRRNTFVTGADNIIRCWIGLPEPERAAVAPETIPRVQIPPEGLPLTAELCWGDQHDRKLLVLPADRRARTADLDLRLFVPDGERYVSAEVAFRYRGRAFEVVHVEAFALPPDEQEQPHQDVQVRVQVSRRQVISLPDSSEYDATIIWGEDPTAVGSPDKSKQPSLRVFGGQKPGSYYLSDADNALKWMNTSMFIAEKKLVRQREAQGAAISEPLLDAGHSEVLTLLRDMARHGTELYNQLNNQGFIDPGERIQLLNHGDSAYVPLEFVYDRGYPADDAKLCDGWQAALLSDRPTCPVCSQVSLTVEQRDKVSTICPLGFWSLQKIIERLDPGSPMNPQELPEAPSAELTRRSLPPINTMLFASSHRVPDNERQSTWQELQDQVPLALQVDDWDQWKQALKKHHPMVLLLLPHHDANQAAIDYLEIGDENLPPVKRQLSRAQLTKLYVNPDNMQPGPIVLLLGCKTGAQTEVGYVQLARRFQQLPVSIVLGTLAKVLGRHAAPVARELISQLIAVEDPQADFGTIMRRVRRRMLAKGYLMALCLVALGDAEWRITPLTQIGDNP